jgi:hypothetical protein
VTDRRYCFIFGCPRSGTTALTRLLNSHEAFVVGMERYKYHYSSTQGRAALGPDFFEPGRYFDFRPEDTNITPSNERFARFYERARRRFDAATVVYVGDKVLATDPILDAIRENFPDPRFIFIYRDLFRVASSWEVRARNEKDENWVAANDYRVAGERWQGAFEVAERLIDQIGLEHVSLVRYERMFNGDVCHFDALLRRLDCTTTLQPRNGTCMRPRAPRSPTNSAPNSPRRWTRRSHRDSTLCSTNSSGVTKPRRCKRHADVVVPQALRLRRLGCEDE